MSWLSWIIRKMTGAYYNHVGIAHEIEGEWVITEADDNGVHPELLVKRLSRTSSEIKIIDIQLSKDTKSKLIGIWGQGYGEITLLKYAWAILTKKPMRDKASRTGRTWVCSHVVAYALNMPDWWRVDPKTLYDRLN